MNQINKLILLDGFYISAAILGKYARGLSLGSSALINFAAY
ncbi:hypothetical protein SOHN41_00800 [Shewanella sp. HN-41]|nr:hypothetical protein SOHN41_00800 [Shewanella sp. HN-41]